MKKVRIIIAGLYLYFEFLVVMLPMLLSWTGVDLPSNVDNWMSSSYLYTAVLLFCIPTLILLVSGVLCAISSLKKPPVPPSESIALMKTQMVMRLMQIPGYVVVFAIACIFFMFIFTFGFSIFFIIMDSASIMITGLFSIPVYVSLYKNGLIERKQMFCYCLLSFVFCADLGVSIACYNHVKAQANK